MRRCLCILALLLLSVVSGAGEYNLAQNQPGAGKDKQPEKADTTTAPDFAGLEYFGKLSPKSGKSVFQASFSTDGKYLGYLVYPGPRLVVTETAGGHEVLDIVGWEFRSFAFGPNGEIAGKAKDGVRVWDATATEIANFPELASTVFVSFAPDGSVVAFGGEDLSLHWLDVKEGKERFSFKTGIERAFAAAVSPDGKQVAVLGASSLKVFRLSDGTELWGEKAKENDRFASGLDFSPDGKRLVGGTGVHDATSGKLLLEIPGYLHCAQFDRTGGTIVSADHEGIVYFSDATSGEVKSKLMTKAHTNGVPCMAMSPDDTQLAIIDYVSVDLYGFRRKPVSLDKHEGNVKTVQFSRDGNTLLAACEGGVAKVWNLADNTVLATLKPEAGFKVARLSPDGASVLFGNEKGLLEQWGVSTSKQFRSFQAEGAEVVSLDFSPDGKMFASADKGKAGQLKVWDVATGKVLHQADNGFLASVRFSPDGTMLATSTYATIFVKNVSDWSDRVRLDPFALGFCFAPDSKTMVTKRDDNGWVRRHDLQTGENIEEANHIPSITGVAGISYGKGGIAMGGSVITWWSAADGISWQRLAAPGGSNIVECSLDGRWLAGAQGTSVYLWPAPTPPQRPCKLIEHPELIAARIAREEIYRSGLGFRGATHLRATDTHLFFFTREAKGFVLNSARHGEASAKLIAQAPADEIWSEVASSTAGTRYLYFSVIAKKKKDIHLYRTDGTVEGTKFVSNFPTGDKDPSLYFVLNDKLFCQGGSYTESDELFCSDGTAEGTGVLKSLYYQEYGRGDGESEPHSFFVHGGKLMFFAAPESGKLALFTTDGTKDGTKIVVNCGEGPDLNGWPLVRMGDSMYFAVLQRPDDGEPEVSLWKITGNSGRRVRGGFKGWNSLRNACVLNDKLYFRAALSKERDRYYEQLWVSDGEEAGTKQVAKFIDAENFLEVCGVTVAGEEVVVATVHYQQSGEEARVELWAYKPSDGSGRWVSSFMKYHIDFDAGSLDGQLDFEQVGKRAFFAGSRAKIGGTVLFTDGRKIAVLGDPDTESEEHGTRALYRFGDKFAFFLVYQSHVRIVVADPLTGTFTTIKRDS